MEEEHRAEDDAPHLLAHQKTTVKRNTSFTLWSNRSKDEPHIVAAPGLPACSSQCGSPADLPSRSPLVAGSAKWPFAAATFQVPVGGSRTIGATSCVVVDEKIAFAL
jgi:hypothetical protein